MSQATPDQQQHKRKEKFLTLLSYFEKFTQEPLFEDPPSNKRQKANKESKKSKRQKVIEEERAEVVSEGESSNKKGKRDIDACNKDSPVTNSGKKYRSKLLSSTKKNKQQSTPDSERKKGKTPEQAKTTSETTNNSNDATNNITTETTTDNNATTDAIKDNKEEKLTSIELAYDSDDLQTRKKRRQSASFRTPKRNSRRMTFTTPADISPVFLV